MKYSHHKERKVKSSKRSLFANHLRFTSLLTTRKEVVFIKSADSQIVAFSPLWLPPHQLAACLLLWWGIRCRAAVHRPGIRSENHPGSVGAFCRFLLDLQAIPC